MISVRDNLRAMLFNSSRIFHKSALVLSCLFVSFTGFSQSIPPPPNPPRLVNDFAHLMSPGEVNALENKLDRYNDSTSTQIAIVTVETLDGDEVGSYASELGEKWGIGTKKNLNGLVILLAKKERKVTIRTGYGVEEKLGAIICKRIIDETLTPNFKGGNFYAGFDAATTEMIQRLAGTFEDKGSHRDGQGNGIPIWVIIAIVVFLLFILPRFFGGGGNGGTFGGGGFTGGVIGGFLGSGGFGGGGGSDSGGGFGGFGGGGFSGGGASGDW